MNNGIVYAAFNFEGRDDKEMAFNINDKLKVLSKEVAEEDHWWLCQRVGLGGETGQGLVPENMVAVSTLDNICLHFCRTYIFIFQLFIMRLFYSDRTRQNIVYNIYSTICSLYCKVQIHFDHL